MDSNDVVLQRQVETFQQALSDFVRAYLLGERDQICCHDISLTQWYAIETLLRGGPCTLNQLAANLDLDKSTASRVVKTLERKRYVGRAQHPVDARSVLLDVTSAGRRLHERIRADRLAERTALLAGFAPEVRDGMTEVMRHLAGAARQRMACASQSTSTSE